MKNLFKTKSLVVIAVFIAVIIPFSNPKALTQESLNNITIPKNDGIYKKSALVARDRYPALYAGSTSKQVSFRFVGYNSSYLYSAWRVASVGTTYTITNPAGLQTSPYIELNIKQTTPSAANSTFSGVWFY